MATCCAKAPDRESVVRAFSNQEETSSQAAQHLPILQDLRLRPLDKRNVLTDLTGPQDRRETVNRLALRYRPQ